MPQRSSLLVEFGWLALFLAIFAVLIYLFNIFIVPHHFNEKIAIMLAAILAAIAMIAARSRWQR